MVGYQADLIQAKKIYAQCEKAGNPGDPVMKYSGTSRQFFTMSDQAATQQEWLPLPSQMAYIWQVYLVNIDPCIKVLHVPTVSRVIEESKGTWDKHSSLVN